MSGSKKGLFDWYFKTNLLVRIFIGLILGAIVGIVLAMGDAETAAKVNGYVKPFGDAFIRLLKMIIVPVVLFSLIVGTASMHPSRLGKVGLKTIAFYLATSACAAIIGLIFAIIFRPGLGVTLAGVEGVAKKAAEMKMSQIILDIIPENIFAAFTGGVVLQIIFFALMFGLALAFMRDAENARIKATAETVYDFFEGASEAVFMMVRWIMQYAPIGVFALIVSVFALNGAKVAGPLVKVTIIVYLALIVHLIVVYGGMLATQKMNIFNYIKKARDPMITAFVTRSSGGTLPITSRTADNMGISRGVYSFTLPIGATINMDGTTIYLAICAAFIANAIGAPLTLTQMVLVVLISVLASIGTAGVPGAGALMLLMVLEAIGLNVEAGSVVAAAYALIFGIDALLDMGRTSMNVTGDLTCALVVAKTENEFDEEKYNNFDGSNA